MVDCIDVEPCSPSELLLLQRMIQRLPSCCCVVCARSLSSVVPAQENRRTEEREPFLWRQWSDLQCPGSLNVLGLSVMLNWLLDESLQIGSKLEPKGSTLQMHIVVLHDP